MNFQPTCLAVPVLSKLKSSSNLRFQTVSSEQIDAKYYVRQRLSKITLSRQETHFGRDSQPEKVGSRKEWKQVIKQDFRRQVSKCEGHVV